MYRQAVNYSRKAVNYSRTIRATLSAKSLVKVPNSPIVSHHVTTQSNNETIRRSSMYNLIGERSSTSAFIYLNRGHKYNTLSDGVIYDLKRFLESYEMDDNVSAVWLQNKGDTFSKGVDMKSVLHNVQNNKPEEAYEYLRKAYDFSMFLGSYMKPLLILLDGEIANASASMFATRPHVIATPNSKWSLNETSYGYITDCGASYHLSRMPFEVGTYLALTGKVLSGKEIQSLGLAFTYTDRDLTDLRVHFIETNTTVVRPTNSLHLYGDRYQQAKEKRENEEAMLERNMEEEINYRVNVRGENAKLVLAEIKYRQELLTNSNRNFGGINETNRMGYADQPLINHTLDFERMILNNIELFEDEGALPRLPFEAINRCFKGSTVEEIFRDLEEEGTEWARQTLEVLKTKSMMSLKLTLRLIREGLRSEWGDCLKREYRVACRRINDDEFKRAAEAKLVNREKQFNAWTYKKPEDITPEALDKYFAPLEQIEEYKPTLPQYSVAPFKNYYKEFPDLVRYWLNKQTIKDFELRSDYLFDVKSFLGGAYHIDLNNPLYSHDLIRERVFQIEEAERKIRMQYDRLFEIARSRKNVEKYYETRKAFIEDFFKDSKKADQTIRETVSTLFEEKFEENLQKKQEFASKARRQDKKQTFKKIKKSITDNRLIETVSYGRQTNDRDEVVLDNIAIPLFFPKNPYESFLDVVNPDISSTHPYIKYVKDLKLQKKFPTSQRDVYMQGYVANERIGTFVLEGDHTNEKIPSPYNTRTTKPAMREDFTKIDLKIKELETLYGEDPVVSKWRDRLYEEVLEILVDRKDGISQLLKKDPKVKDYLLETVRRGDYGDNVANESVTLENLIRSRPKEAQEAGIEQLEALSGVISKSFDSILGTHNFVEFEPEALNKSNLKPKSIVANSTELKEDAENNYEKQFLGMVKLDERLTDILSPFFTQEHSSPASQSFALKLKDLLLEIYKKKVNQVLKTERDKFKNIKPLFTKDGQNVLHSKNAGQNEEQFMEAIDDYINNNVLFEFHRYIASHVFFVFSYFGLLELEKMYSLLTKVIGTAKRNNEAEGEKSDNFDANFSMVAKLLREKDIKIANKEELGSMLQYLNDATANICRLFYIYQEQIHFNEDLLLDKYLKVKYSSNGPSNRKNFVSVAQEHFQNYHLFKEGMSTVGQPFQDEAQYKPDSEAYKFIMTNHNDLHEQDEREVWETSLEETAAQPQVSRVYKNFIPGSFQYLIDLEKATKRATYGKFNAFAGEDFTAEDLTIPDYFHGFDLREPLPEWFNKKLKEVLRRYLDERSKFQDLLSREDLIALDQDFVKLLSAQNIKESVLTTLENDLSALTYCRDVFEMAESNEANIDFQATKAPRFQQMIDKGIKNPEALNKYMAYGLSMYDRYKKKDHKQMNPALLGVRSDTLKRIYREAFSQPRPIPTMEAFTDVLRKDEAAEERVKNIAELRVLSENNINNDTSMSLRRILEESRGHANRLPDLQAELEYFFKRHDIMGNQ